MPYKYKTEITIDKFLKESLKEWQAAYNSRSMSDLLRRILTDIKNSYAKINVKTPPIYEQPR